MRRRKSARLCLLLPRLRQDWPRLWRVLLRRCGKSARTSRDSPRLWQDSPCLWRVSVKMRRKVEREGASPRERCRSPSQRGGIPVPPRLHRVPTAQDRGGTAGNWWFSSYVILHFLRTGVAPSREVSNGVFALRLGKCFSALFSRCVQKREEGCALRVQSYGLPLRGSIPKCGYFLILCCIYFRLCVFSW